MIPQPLRAIAFRALAGAMFLATLAHAHFPFVVPDANGATAKLYMSEILAPDGEVKIELLAGTKLSVRGKDGKDTPLTLEPRDHAMALTLPGGGTRVVHGVADLGIMQRGDKPAHWLVYYPKTIVGDAFDPATVLGDAVPVELSPVRVEGGLKLKLVIAGKPAGKAKVRVITPDGAQDEYDTDDAGLTQRFPGKGRYGAWARSWIDEKGERDGKPYAQKRNYATIVFDFVPDTNATVPATQPVSAIPPLPEAVASFGAVAAGQYLYVYGGHIAERHEYSTESVSGRFHRIDLRAPSKWETLPPGVAVQGMNLAAHASKVYRVGGMEPRNPPGAEEDNHSIAQAQRFDPQRGVWEALPPLPAPRSSHDVVFVGDKLYVLGGWNMKGKDAPNEWLTNVAVLDTAADPPVWTTIEQPFKRRALVATVLGRKILVIGGMDDDDNVQRDVDILDTETNTWSKGPSIPGKGFEGFSPAACVVDGRVYLSVASGKLYQLSDKLDAWTELGKTTPRIVHRMVPTEKGLLLVGGAAKSKMLDLIELFPLAKSN